MNREIRRASPDALARVDPSWKYTWWLAVYPLSPMFFARGGLSLFLSTQLHIAAEAFSVERICIYNPEQSILQRHNCIPVFVSVLYGHTLSNGLWETIKLQNASRWAWL